MRIATRRVSWWIAAVAFGLGGTAQAQSLAPGGGTGPDPFGGRLFPPNLVLENQRELDLTEAQRSAIRAAVVTAQSEIAEHQWSLMEAYQSVIAELDRTPIDEAKVLAQTQAVLRAENEVKLTQVAMLIKLRNVLTDRQVEYLQSLRVLDR